MGNGLEGIDLGVAGVDSVEHPVFGVLDLVWGDVVVVVGVQVEVRDNVS
jgi:hypothetical protein